MRFGTSRLESRWTAVVMAIALCNLAYAPPLPSSQTVSFGVFGLAANQTVRVNVVNPAVTPLEANCLAQIVFLDAHGSSLKSTSASVGGGQVISEDLSRDEIQLDAKRVEIRATVTSTLAGVPDTADLASSCRLIPTLEVFDNDSGRTSLILTQTTTVLTPLP